MYSTLISKVQLHLANQFRLQPDLIGEFFDSLKKVLVQSYQCAHTEGNTTLIIVFYTEFGAVINYVDDSFRMDK